MYIDDNTAITDDMTAAIYSLNNCFSTGLRLLHPIMPFVTEELYHHLPKHLRLSDSICISQFPEPVDAWVNVTLEEEMENMKTVVHSLRSLAATLGIPQNIHKTGFIVSKDEIIKNALAKLLSHISILSKFEKVI